MNSVFGVFVSHINFPLIWMNICLSYLYVYGKIYCTVMTFVTTETLTREHKKGNNNNIKHAKQKLIHIQIF